ncbi:Uncharacterized conserved UCP022280 [Micractinium conductrix]|uniref:Uncharacterized conserved UCP022280 n=1 Tax=Micractinium conductrix TaxID=554055 RepID=A0A2P6VDU9_9CHLO|nr:Uncharacterized conserved UCP022280 [Micractinium conductrix]|eukprot:PSC72249.1 Uncharacterized conserved UCP022280 [Micractinium conductrix]
MAGSEGGEKKGALDFLSSLTSAGKVWENKVEEAAHNATAQLKSVGATAEEYLDAGVAQASAAVRSGLSAAGRESKAVQSRVQQFVDTGKAHYEATEAQALDAFRAGVRFVTKEHPEASLAGGIAAAALLLPGPRRFLLRNTLVRFRSEEAMFRSAEARYAGLVERVEAQQGELAKLQDRLHSAETEYVSALRSLKSAAGDLQSLGSRAEGSSKAARGLVSELRQLPSKAALQLRSDAANAAAAAGSQAKAVEKALKHVAKSYGI